MTIYEIDQSIEQLLTSGFVYNEETGEIDTTLDEQTLYKMLEDKMEDYAIYIKSREAFTGDMRAEKKNLEDRIKREEKRIERLKSTLLAYMEKYGMTRMEAPRATVGTRINHKVIIDDEEALLDYCKKHHKDDCYTLNIAYKPVKSAIKKQIDDFEDMAHIETSKSISVK